MTPESPLPAYVGRYRVVKELGKGAMGRVLLAEDPVLRREVAIKHLRGDLSLAPEQRKALLERMSQEARASARVNHPHLVALFDMGEDPELGLYLVFEYVEGVTLHERLKQGPLPTAEAARLVRELGDALGYAHGRGIVHRDVKPENVILSAAGSKLADFGIARLPDSTLTQGNGIVLGTPAYSAPEALRGAKFSPLSDQFSLGATAYEAISGCRAFPGDDALAVAARITNDEPKRIAAQCGLDRSVDLVLSRVMSKTPKLRFASAAEFGAALSDALGAGPRRLDQRQAARAAQPTLPDLAHSERGRPGLGFTLGVALTSAALTLSLSTFFDPSPLAAGQPEPVRVQDISANEQAEEDPPAVAWLALSPEDEASSKQNPSPPPDEAKRREASHEDAPRELIPVAADGEEASGPDEL
jgi:eukaryotic-like serine/threonine-protein kinase